MWIKKQKFVILKSVKMTHQYKLTGMTCSGCEAKVKSELLKVENVTAVEVSKDENSATITMDKHVELDKLQEVLGGNSSKYQISIPGQEKEIVEKKKDCCAANVALALSGSGRAPCRAWRIYQTRFFKRQT